MKEHTESQKKQPIEKWRPIPGYENRYDVSNLGRVRSVTRNVSMYGGRVRVLKGRILCPNTSGRYMQVGLGIDKTKLIHRLVALAWVPNPEYKPCVNHKDGNKSNNYASNLEWVTQTENVRHAFKNKLMKSVMGEDHYFSKLNNKKVIKIRELSEQGILSDEIGKRFNVTGRNIRSIIQGKTWKHLFGCQTRKD